MMVDTSRAAAVSCLTVTRLKLFPLSTPHQQRGAGKQTIKTATARRRITLRQPLKVVKPRHRGWLSAGWESFVNQPFFSGSCPRNPGHYPPGQYPPTHYSAFCNLENTYKNIYYYRYYYITLLSMLSILSGVVHKMH